jgi:hypothetical protein
MPTIIIIIIIIIKKSYLIIFNRNFSFNLGAYFWPLPQFFLCVWNKWKNPL